MDSTEREDLRGIMELTGYRDLSNLTLVTLKTLAKWEPYLGVRKPPEAKARGRRCSAARPGETSISKLSSW